MVFVARTADGEALQKTPTGIAGLDEVTGGGLPQGRSTLICGPAGCGKTLLAMEFLVRGVTHYGEPGVIVSFEQPTHDLVTNSSSVGFDLPAAEAADLLGLDHVNLRQDELGTTGDWNLDGLIERLAASIDTVGAKRIVIDTIEKLYGASPNAAVLRTELDQLVAWLRGRGITAVFTGDGGDATVTRHGIEEYVSDCVIVLDHRKTQQGSTRCLRILRCRGTFHGTNQYPFLIDDQGISVLATNPSLPVGS